MSRFSRLRFARLYTRNSPTVRSNEKRTNQSVCHFGCIIFTYHHQFNYDDLYLIFLFDRFRFQLKMIYFHFTFERFTFQRFETLSLHTKYTIKNCCSNILRKTKQTFRWPTSDSKNKIPASSS